jgi:hypothetical protein
VFIDSIGSLANCHTIAGELQHEKLIALTEAGKH